ncbi:hypothetical protein [Paenarthrobacter nitroguajacolicus]|uniref:hypothetical protein n=1 Tax=Paenarthrobacter nitroguajacolicus TaxID=211146 RepID=UPI0015BFD1D6|nr:hypothetical protein [Paenarthrobacter nitroguajacolicus]NWL34456.1 hypothetical protein [Paenarthrobacter nitroguajacolicus]
MTTELEEARARLAAAAAEAGDALTRRIKQLTLEGNSVPTIAKMLDCSEARVVAARKRTGVNHPGHHHASKIDRGQLRELVSEGKNNDEIAKVFGCHPQRVQAARRREGLPLAPRKAHTRRIDPQQVKDRSEAGEPLASIAEALSCSISSVIKIRHELGISDHSKAKLPEDVKRRIETMLDDGCPFAEITRTLGVTHETLKRHYDGRQWTTEQRAEHMRTLRIGRTGHWGAMPGRQVHHG